MTMGLTKSTTIQVAVMLCGCLLAELNYTLLSPALPVIMSDMSVGETDVQWLMSVYALVEAVVIPLNAFFLGRFSTRKLFAGSFILFAAGSATNDESLATIREVFESCGYLDGRVGVHGGKRSVVARTHRGDHVYDRFIADLADYYAVGAHAQAGLDKVAYADRSAALGVC